VVEELMVEMHLLSVNVDFRYDPIFALGVTTSFDRFMQGYKPEADKDSIFQALCKALGVDSHQYRGQAQRLMEIISGFSQDDLVAWFNQSKVPGGADDLQPYIQAIATNPNFKYSRLFAIGLFTLLEKISPDTIKDNEKLQQSLTQMAEALNVPADKVQKDLELYRSNLEKMEQAKIVLEDILKADRKKREQQEQSPESVATPPDSSQATA
jgi:photosystem II biogenesis protein Psp29